VSYTTCRRARRPLQNSLRRRPCEAAQFNARVKVSLRASIRAIRVAALNVALQRVDRARMTQSPAIVWQVEHGWDGTVEDLEEVLQRLFPNDRQAWWSAIAFGDGGRASYLLLTHGLSDRLVVEGMGQLLNPRSGTLAPIMTSNGEAARPLVGDREGEVERNGQAAQADDELEGAADPTEVVTAVTIAGMRADMCTWWGHWYFDRNSFQLVLTNPVSFRVDLDNICTSEGLLKWIGHVTGKKWCDAETAGHFVQALDDLYRFEQFMSRTTPMAQTQLHTIVRDNEIEVRADRKTDADPERYGAKPVVPGVPGYIWGDLLDAHDNAKAEVERELGLTQRLAQT
jgi:hypothetical protein